ncbi:MAG: valine--tRNA ligase [Puniceicoccales bacterium]|jgi:valyl-tRNA synthetase|nr:valine--tRNA ligase [Puniceicoccales bacterium]
MEGSAKDSASEPLAKTYDPRALEEKWYRHYLERESFEPDGDRAKEPFTLMMPPPNVTGVLHMGHLLNNTIQDILVRRARQEGQRVLWIPGTDHAGIATQTKVEKILTAEGSSRQSIGRDAFVQRASEWRDQHRDIILNQLRKLGVSPSWGHKKHTLDADYSRSVLHGFVELYRRGYIYRGRRMVHWCPVSQTALSDEEVLMKPQSGFFYYVRYRDLGSGELLTVATTRPETIMGDVALAVHPGDERYRSWIGRKVLSPLAGCLPHDEPERLFPPEIDPASGREETGEIRDRSSYAAKWVLPVIADEAVDPKFGTGVLKITPAHDATDFEIVQRYNGRNEGEKLPFRDIFNPDATLNANAGKEFEGLDRFTAREKLVQILEQGGSLEKKIPHEHHVGFSERADVPIEPRLSEQWFLRFPQGTVEAAKKVVRDDLIRFRPAHWKKTYLHWLEHIQDWCISRQLWWGHRIPVWYPKGADRNDLAKMHVSVDGPPDPENWEQDEDVLDTWFSSAFWCLGTLGWPDKEFDVYRDFYPTNELVTGPDIIFFWVARMILMGLEFRPKTERGGGQDGSKLPAEEAGERDILQKNIPFRNVYFTGIIRDAQGRKMSKSLGNSPEPLELIEKYGADGLRLGLISIAPQGQDILFNEDQIAQGKFFCNKLWNAFRLRQMHRNGNENTLSLEEIIRRIDVGRMGAAEHFILAQFLSLNRVTEVKVKGHDFQRALWEWISFFRHSYCDQYLELFKASEPDENCRASALAVQDFILRQLLLWFHAFIPFVTEEIWGLSHYGPDGVCLMNTPLPTAEELDRRLLEQHGEFLDLKRIDEVHSYFRYLETLRVLKTSCGQESMRNVCIYYRTDEETAAAIIEKFRSALMKMAGLQDCQRVSHDAYLSYSPSRTTGEVSFFLNVAARDVEAERQRIIDELAQAGKLAQLNLQKLQSSDFRTRAPQHIVAGAIESLELQLCKGMELCKLLRAHPQQ